MGKVQLVKLSLSGISQQAASAPGHPNLWRTIEQTCGALRFYRSQALVVEWKSEQGSARLPTIDEWRSWLFVPGIHNLELLEKAPHTTLQIRRKGLDPDVLPMLARETLKLKGFSNVERIWLARQTEIVFEKSGQNAPKEVLLETLKLVSSLEEKSGLFRPSSEEMRILIPGEEFVWEFDESKAGPQAEQLKEKVSAHFWTGAWSALKRNYRTQLKEEWSQSNVSESRGSPISQLFEAAAPVQSDVCPGDRGAPVDFVVALPKNPDPYSSMDKLRVRCVGFANLLDRPLGQVLFRKTHSGMTHFDCWSWLGSHQKIRVESVRDDHVLCVLGHWDRRNPVAERRSDSFLKRMLRLDPESQFLFEVLSGGQDWIISMTEFLLAKSTEWNVGSRELSKLMELSDSRNEYSALALGWVVRSKLPQVQHEAERRGVDFFVLARKAEKNGIRVGDSLGNEICELSAEDFFSARSMSEAPIQSSWTIREEKAPVYGFDRAGVYPDEFLLRLSFREPSHSDWVQQFTMNSSGSGYRSLMLRNPECEPLKSYRWSDGRRTWAVAMGLSAESRMHKPQAAAFYALDSAMRELLSMGGNPRDAVVDLMISIPKTGTTVSGEFEASFALLIEGVASLIREFKIPYRSIREISPQLSSNRTELFVRASAPLPDSYPPPFPGFRMAGEQIYALGPKAIFMDGGSKVLEYFSRIESNHLSMINPATLTELYDLVMQLQKNSLLSSVRAIGDGGIACAIAEMGLWSKMGALLRPGLGPIDMFSAAPARFLVGVLPANVARFEAAVKSEWLLPVASVGGEKIIGLPIDKLQSSRVGRRS